MAGFQHLSGKASSVQLGTKARLFSLLKLWSVTWKKTIPDMTSVFVEKHNYLNTFISLSWLYFDSGPCSPSSYLTFSAHTQKHSPSTEQGWAEQTQQDLLFLSQIFLLKKFQFETKRWSEYRYVISSLAHMFKYQRFFKQTLLTKIAHNNFIKHWLSTLCAKFLHLPEKCTEISKIYIDSKIIHKKLRIKQK